MRNQPCLKRQWDMDMWQPSQVRRKTKTDFKLLLVIWRVFCEVGADFTVTTRKEFILK